MKRSYDAPLPFSDISETYDDLMDGPVRLIGGEIVSSLTLADRAYQHEYFGRQLRKQPPRFGFHFTSHESVVDSLGNDADTIGHMYELGCHVATLLREHPDIILSDEERGILMFAVLGHDMDETTHDQVRHRCGGVTGDIQCGKKTDADRLLQAKIRRYRDQILYPDVPGSILARVEAIVSHTDETILGALYEAAHELQALETTVRAEHTLMSGEFDPAHQASIEHVAFDVRGEVSAHLIPYIGTFAYVGRRLADVTARSSAA